MEAMDADFYHTQLSELESMVDAVESSPVKGKAPSCTIDDIVSGFASTIEHFTKQCSATDRQFTRLFTRVQHLTESKGSLETRTKMQAVFQKVSFREMKHFDSEMRPLLDRLSEAGQSIVQRVFAAISSEEGTDVAVKKMEAALQNLNYLLLFVQHGDLDFVKKMLFLCDISVASKDIDGNTLLHRAAGRADITPATVARLVELGVPVNEVNEQGETALDNAVRKNNLPMIKALVRAGATIGLYTTPIDPEVSQYLNKQRLKKVGTQIASANETVLYPPNKPNHLDHFVKSVLPATLTGGAGVAKLVGSNIDAAKIGLPIFDVTNFIHIENRCLAANNALREKTNELDKRIELLEDRILSTVEPVKSTLSEELERLKQEKGLLLESARIEQRHLELELLKKGLSIPENIKMSYIALSKGITGNALLMSTALTYATNALTSGATIYQNWNQLTNIEIKRRYLTDVRVALQASHSELSALYQQLDPHSMEGRLVKLKLGNSESKMRYIDEQSAQLARKSIATKIGIAGTSVACGLMVYGAAMYAEAYYEERDTESIGSSTVKAAGVLNAVFGAIPQIAPTLISGLSWLVYGRQDAESQQRAKLAKEQKSLREECAEIREELEHGQLTIFGLRDVPEEGSALHTDLVTRLEVAEKRLSEIATPVEECAKSTAERRREIASESTLRKQKKALEQEQGDIEYELQFGEMQFMGVRIPYEVDSPEYQQLTARLAKIHKMQAEIAAPLEQYELAKQLGLTRAQMDDSIKLLEADIKDVEKRALLQSLIHAAGIDTSDFDTNPRRSILEYLTK